MDELFGFEGRINRAKMWQFILFCIVVEILAFIVIAMVFDFGFVVDWWVALSSGAQDDRGSLIAFNPESGELRQWLGLAAVAVVVGALFWASLALALKRLHDRNKSGWWLMLFYAIPGVLSGVAVIPEIAEPQSITMAWVAIGLGLTMLVIEIWAFVELYCLRGTRGENRFGPDPLAR